TIIRRRLRTAAIPPLATYFDACRRKRNHVDYDFADVASDTEAHELIEKVEERVPAHGARLVAKKHPNSSHLYSAIGNTWKKRRHRAGRSLFCKGRNPTVANDDGH